STRSSPRVRSSVRWHADRPDDPPQPPSPRPTACHQPPYQAAAPKLVRNSGPGLATVARLHAQTRPTCSGTQTKGSRDAELRANRLFDRISTHRTPRPQVCSGILVDLVGLTLAGPSATHRRPAGAAPRNAVPFV